MKLSIIILILITHLELFSQKNDSTPVLINERSNIANNDTILLPPDSLTKSLTISEISSQEPFSWGDFTWMQGNNRQHNALLDSKLFTGTLTIDGYYNLSFNHPKDHTTIGSTATFREGEYNLSYVALGGDFHYKNVRACLLLQFGTRTTAIPHNDNTPLRGQFDLYTAMRYIAECYAGTHLNIWNGINIDVGIFM